MNTLSLRGAGDLRGNSVKRRAGKSPALLSSRRGRSGSGITAVEALEVRRLLSAGTLSPLAGFNGVNGAQPRDVVADASGNLFGVTKTSVVGGQENGPGEVFEIPAGTTTIKVLVTFSNGDGGQSLVIDSNGNLYGSTEGGSLFEVAAGTSTIIPLAQPGLVTVTAVDSAGDLFGTASSPSPFELVHGSSAITLLAPPPNSADTFSATDVIVDTSGNIYGTAGDQTDGVIFEIPAGTTNFETLATFDNATTGSLPLGVAIDVNGNLYGDCEYGGANGEGTVFELPSGSSTISLLASFNSATGDVPVSLPVLDSSGDLYGMTDNGGASGFGTVFGVNTSTGAIEDVADLGSNICAGQNQVGIVTNAANQPYISPSATAAENPATALVNAFIWVSNGTEGNVDLNESKITYETEGNVVLNDSPDPNGIIDRIEAGLVIPSRPTANAKDPATDKGALKQLVNGLHELLSQWQAQAQRGVGKSLVRPDESGLPSEFAELKKMLAQIKSQLSHATTELSSATRFYKSYTTEGTTITRLDAQLAAQTKSAVEARLQKRITAAEKAQDKDADSDNADCDSAEANLNNATSGEAAVQTGLNTIT